MPHLFDFNEYKDQRRLEQLRQQRLGLSSGANAIIGRDKPFSFIYPPTMQNMAAVLSSETPVRDTPEKSAEPTPSQGDSEARLTALRLDRAALRRRLESEFADIKETSQMRTKDAENYERIEKMPQHNSPTRSEHTSSSVQPVSASPVSSMSAAEEAASGLDGLDSEGALDKLLRTLSPAVRANTSNSKQSSPMRQHKSKQINLSSNTNAPKKNNALARARYKAEAAAARRSARVVAAELYEKEKRKAARIAISKASAHQAGAEEMLLSQIEQNLRQYGSPRHNRPMAGDYPLVEILNDDDIKNVHKDTQYLKKLLKRRLLKLVERRSQEHEKCCSLLFREPFACATNTYLGLAHARQRILNMDNTFHSQGADPFESASAPIINGWNGRLPANICNNWNDITDSGDSFADAEGLLDIADYLNLDELIKDCGPEVLWDSEKILLGMRMCHADTSKDWPRQPSRRSTSECTIKSVKEKKHTASPHQPLPERCLFKKEDPRNSEKRLKEKGDIMSKVRKTNFSHLYVDIPLKN